MPATTPASKAPKRARAKAEPTDEYVPGPAAKKPRIRVPKVKSEPDTSTTTNNSLFEPELPFLSQIDDWSSEDLLEYIIHSSLISVPAKPPHPHVKFFTVTSSFPSSSSSSTLPIRYRIPLLYCVKRVWSSIKSLVSNTTCHPLSSPPSSDHFQLLHLVRNINHLLHSSTESMEHGSGVDSHWRCPPFDRMLLRFKHSCFLLDPGSTSAFDDTFFQNVSKSDLNARDVLLTNWKRWCMKADTGRLLTNEQIDDGITYPEYAKGLVFLNGQYAWSRSYPIDPALAHIRNTPTPVLPPHLVPVVERPVVKAVLPPLPRQKKPPVTIKLPATATTSASRPPLPRRAPKPAAPPVVEVRDEPAVQRVRLESPVQHVRLEPPVQRPRMEPPVQRPRIEPQMQRSRAEPPVQRTRVEPPVQRSAKQLAVHEELPMVNHHQTFLDQLSVVFQPLLSEVTALRHDIRDLRNSNMLYTTPSRPSTWSELER